jgi:hypothetical protein
VGPAHALDLLFSARKVDAREAERIGLVNRVLPHHDLLKFVHEYVVDLATHCSPTSMRIMKRQVYQHLTAELGAAHGESVKLMLESFDRPDFSEGVSSFLTRDGSASSSCGSASEPKARRHHSFARLRAVGSADLCWLAGARRLAARASGACGSTRGVRVTLRPGP